MRNAQKDRKLIKYKIKEDVPWSDRVLLELPDGDIYWLDKNHIYPLETDECVSWYKHDVLKKLRYVYWDSANTEGGAQFFLETSKLYSITKLKKLARSEAFKKQQFAFFNYGFVQRLIGARITDKGMSGLFASK